ncbi:hypothetical protein NA56DRAFT_259737 [Hyaloscypha hepaticicola]|uniref:LITAF domain-containing protein n=1 Tax=Hyaloscypha hepaticicola TaxID=2082293 RepID=A0A2J6PUW3_9HELO|nr:hypothetical protein NA56DRAFT_259737 [Hyaloscypha hepaticicola]
MPALDPVYELSAGLGQPETHPQLGTGITSQRPTPLPCLGEEGELADCPSCGHRAVTRTARVVGYTTHAAALGVFVFTALMCWIPYLVDYLKDVEHRCGSCGVLLATWNFTTHKVKVNSVS